MVNKGVIESAASLRLRDNSVEIEIVAKMNTPVDTIMIDGVLKISAIIRIKTLPSQKIPTKRTILTDNWNFLK